MANKDQYQALKDFSQTVVIDVSEDDDLSSALALGGMNPVAVQTPNALTSTSHLRILGSIDGSNFFQIFNSLGVIVQIINPSADKIYSLNPIDFYGVKYIKIETDSAEASDRTFNVVLGSY